MATMEDEWSTSSTISSEPLIPIRKSEAATAAFADLKQSYGIWYEFKSPALEVSGFLVPSKCLM